MNDESKSTAASSSETVMFDVGGKIYKVSHSLLEQHSETVLAKLVDDKWLADSDKCKPVFIERNGNAFEYVLDYLRYGSVELPPNIMMSTVTRELDYYGIDVVEDTIKQDSPADELHRLKKVVADAELNHDMFVVAVHANHQFMKGENIFAIGNNAKDAIGLKKSPSEYASSSALASDVLKEYLMSYYGLKAYDIVFSKTTGMSLKMLKPDWTNGESLSSSGSKGDIVNPKPGDWRCNACSTSNPKGERKCLACETSKPYKFGEPVNAFGDRVEERGFGAFPPMSASAPRNPFGSSA